MNVNLLHQKKKPVSIAKLKSNTNSALNSIHIKSGESLKTHINQVDAFIIITSGRAIYEDERGERIVLTTGGYLQIPSNLKHAITATEELQLLLIVG